MGRWAAKKLLGSAYPSFNAVRMDEISILNETSGSPYVLVYGIRVPGVLSITHREGMACAAWVSDAAIKIGIDLEFVETKPDIFIHDYFTAEESQQVLAASLVWSVKESLLKALQTGLRVDTREVAVSISSFETSEQWKSIRVSRCAKHTGFVNAAWRSIGDFVLTCAALGECALERPLLFQQV
jgi:phosphopantetheinyl transferase (holo-ACP synthase)